MLRLIEDRIDHFGAHVLALGWRMVGLGGVESEPPYHFDTPIGRVNATTTLRVTVRGPGLEVAMTAAEARKYLISCDSQR